MEDVKILDEIATIKAIAHPLRIRIIEEFGGKAYTAKQIADKMKESPAKIYYHIIEMESVGILRLVRTVENSGILEKYYEPVARYFKISKELLSNDKEFKSETLKIFDNLFKNMDRDYYSYLSKIKETHEKFPKDSGISYITMHLDETKFKEFMFKLTELFHEYSKFAESDDTKEYKAGFIVFPKNQ